MEMENSPRLISRVICECGTFSEGVPLPCTRPSHQLPSLELYLGTICWKPLHVAVHCYQVCHLYDLPKLCRHRGTEPQSRGVSTSSPVLLKLWLTSGNCLMHSTSSGHGKELSRKKSDLIWQVISYWSLCIKEILLTKDSSPAGLRTEVKLG